MREGKALAGFGKRARWRRPTLGRSLRKLADERLFEGLRQGSERHFDALYERYFPRIYAFVYLRVRNHADAEELVQETFAAVFRSASAWEGRSAPLAWIYGIARNTVASHLRRVRLHGERMEQAGPRPLMTSSPAWAFTPEDHLALRRYARALDQRLGDVSEWQAEAFWLRHVENLPSRRSVAGPSARTMRSGPASIG